MSAMKDVTQHHVAIERDLQPLMSRYGLIHLKSFHNTTTQAVICAPDVACDARPAPVLLPSL